MLRTVAPGRIGVDARVIAISLGIGLTRLLQLLLRQWVSVQLTLVVG